MARKGLKLAALLGLCVSQTAYAQVTSDRVAFRVEGRVLVWDDPSARVPGQSFFVASNTGFVIDAARDPQAQVDLDIPDDATFRLTVALGDGSSPHSGSAAQYPHTAGPGAGLLANGLPPAAFDTPVRVFEGDQRTARTRASVQAQSVRFEAGWQDAQGTFLQAPGLVFTVSVP